MPAPITTLSATPLFFNARPAWERTIAVSIKMQAISTTSRDGLMQTHATTNRGIYTIRYAVVRNRASRLAYQPTQLAQLTAPTWVPFWPFRALTTNSLGIGGTSVSISLLSSVDWFAAGDWVLLYEASAAGTNQWRQIASVTGQTLTLVALGGSLAFGTGSSIAPARLCVRERGEAQADLYHETSEIESVNFRTL